MTDATPMTPGSGPYVVTKGPQSQDCDVSGPGVIVVDQTYLDAAVIAKACNAAFAAGREPLAAQIKAAVDAEQERIAGALCLAMDLPDDAVLRIIRNTGGHHER